jgi:hypothetical protein
LSDPGPPDGSDDSGLTGLLGSFFGSVPRVIGSITGLIAAVTGLLVALNKVGILGGDGGGGGGTTTSGPAESIFAPLTRPNGRVYFDGKTMYVKAAAAGRPLLELADLEEPLQDVAMSSRVSWVSGARDYGVGFICRFQNTANYYVLAVLSGGRYSIVKYRKGKLTPMTGIKQSGAITEDTNNITARCVGAKPTSLTLQANGQTIGTVQDPDGIESGNIGVRVGSSESFVTTRFEDFVLKYLE